MLKAYPVRDKRKSAEICNSFVAGAPHEADGSVFYGVDRFNLTAWHESDDIWYIDNSFYDNARQTYFRVARNALQHSGLGRSDGVRFRKLGIPILPWRDGSHIVLCQQSDHFMHKIAAYEGDWIADTVGQLSTLTKRPLRIRAWSSDKGRLAETLLADLDDAHALVTWSSSAAVTATLCGVRSVSMGESAAAPMGGKLEDVENLPTPEREEWAGILADNQFTLQEMRDGTAWAMLNRG